MLKALRRIRGALFDAYDGEGLSIKDEIVLTAVTVMLIILEAMGCRTPVVPHQKE